MILVDYRCPSCGRTAEAWVPSPAPATRSAPCCGVAARRRFGGRVLTEGAAPAREGGPPIPGLCTLTPTAQRAMTARVRGDTRALEREIAHQESAICPASSPITPFSNAPGTG